MARAKQYADRVNVIKRIKVNGKWPFAPVVERNGRIVRDHVWVSGREERHPEGRYYLEWYKGGKRRRQAIASFDQVVEAARKKSLELDALGPASSDRPRFLRFLPPKGEPSSRPSRTISTT